MEPKKFRIKDLGSLLKDTFNEWNEDEPFIRSASLSYYTIFSLPALLLIVIYLVGVFFGEETAQKEVVAYAREMISADVAREVEKMMNNLDVLGNTVWAAIVGIGTLVFGATTVFYQLQQNLNQIWDLKPVPKKAVLKLLKDRLFSFGMILIIGLLLLVSLILTAIINSLGQNISELLPGISFYIIETLNMVISFSFMVVLFAAIFKILPDAEIKWKYVWLGGIVTTILFIIGKFLLGLYFRYADPASAFGAAGTLIILMLWVNYACLILFFGAEFTQVYARWYGARIQPAPHAIRISDYYINKKSKLEDKKEKEEMEKRS